MFNVENRKKLRRRAKLGILAHQPAVATYCRVTESERETIIENLLKQKVGCNPKSVEVFHDMEKAEKGNHEQTVALRPPANKILRSLRKAGPRCYGKVEALQKTRSWRSRRKKEI